VRRWHLIALAALAAAGLATAGLVVSGASFTSSSDNPQSIGAVADFLAPDATSRVVKSAGGTAGALRQGATFHVYANVTDSGNPASGVASATANLSSLVSGAGAGAVALSAGSWTVDGVAYNYRSAEQTARSTLAEGTLSYSLTSADGAGNSDAKSFSVTIDNTRPVAASVSATNGSGTAGRPDSGDVVALGWSEAIDPDSVIDGWTGAARAATVRIVDKPSGDELSVQSPAALGTVDLDGDYVSADTSFSATMSASGATVSIQLTASPAASTVTAGNHRLRWTPAATVTDAAGNASTTAAFTESNTAPDF
jgi:hypothetical protein